MKQHILFFFLFSAVLLAVPSLPQQFYAETRVESVGQDGAVETLQHDFIWYDAVANKMKTISVDEIFGDNSTVIYRGDLKREYYFVDNLDCHYIYVPDVIDVKLAVKEGATLEDVVDVGGVQCQLWVYRALNEDIKYYISDDNNLYPVKIQISSGSSTFTITFSVFKATVPSASIFEIGSQVNCDRSGLKGVQSKENLIDYLSSVPTLTTPIQPRKVLSRVNTGVDPATLALIGKTVWAVIKENKPESNLEANQNAVIPQGTTWTDMAGWRQNKWPGWQWTLINAYGARTVDYSWSFNHLCLGSYKNVGRYIENAGAFPTGLSVAWGYKVNVKAQVLNPFNYGTSSAPIAGLSLIMTMESTTLIKKITQSCHVNLLGNCESQMVSCDNYKSSVKFTYY